MNLNALDWILIVLAVAYALSGYWQGFVTGLFATVGLVLGGLLGIWLAPKILGDAAPSPWVSLGALLIVLVAASLGQALLQYAGSQVRSRITWQPARALDAVGGAALSVVAVLVVTWALGVAISGSRLPVVGPLVRGSRVLVGVNEVMPASAQGVLRSFEQVVGSSFFPRYLEPFAPERIVEVAPAPARVARDPDVDRAQASVVKVRGNNSCGNGVEGSGFVYAPGRVMTNAHVVAGVTRPTVRVGGRQRPATVVLYNPRIDVAVLRVDGLTGPTVRFDQSAAARQVGAVLGFPNDGPYDVEPARIRSKQQLRSPDIYGEGTVTREVFSLRSTVRPGNSGGPLVSTGGQVLGVVFAASVRDGSTGYALTARQVSGPAFTGRTATERVDTGGCA